MLTNECDTGSIPEVLDTASCRYGVVLTVVRSHNVNFQKRNLTLKSDAIDTSIIFDGSIIFLRAT